jgi:hypothetical protein
MIIDTSKRTFYHSFAFPYIAPPFLGPKYDLALSRIKTRNLQEAIRPPGGSDWHPLESYPHDCLQKVKVRLYGQLGFGGKLLRQITLIEN